MNTQTAEIIRHEDAPRRSAEIAVLKPTRLPYHDAIGDRFGIDRAGWKALVEAVWPSAQSIDSVAMALSYCRARKLDPFKKPVHIVPMWDSKSGGYIETVWPGIAELRTTAFRTGQYAGCDEAEFGPIVQKTFSGRVKRKKEWEDATVTVEYPEWCRMTVYRDLNGRVCKFVGPKVRWLASYATIGASDLPNDMWENRAEEQLEKCAEAAALRRAFPEEIGNELTAEEMAGRRLAAEPRDVTPTHAAPPPPPPPPAIEHKAPPEPRDSVVKEMVENSPQAPARAPAPPPPDEADIITPDDILSDIDIKLAAAGSHAVLDQTWDMVADDVSELPMHLREQAQSLYEAHAKRIGEG